MQIIGPIRQEVLSGVRVAAQFDKLKDHLAAFPDLLISTDDYVVVARFFNICRASGSQWPNTDFPICAAAVRNRVAIYTTDKDFKQFAKHLPFVLHEP